MLYSELIAEIADRTNLKKANAKAAVDTMVEIITECAKKGEDVAVNKLGTFRSKMVPRHGAGGYLRHGPGLRHLLAHQ